MLKPSRTHAVHWCMSIKCPGSCANACKVASAFSEGDLLWPGWELDLRELWKLVRWTKTRMAHEGKFDGDKAATVADPMLE